MSTTFTEQTYKSQFRETLLYKRFQAIWCQLKLSNNNVKSHCFETTSSRKQRQCKAASLKAGTGAPSNKAFVAT